jgi:hypothetical protein
MKTVLFIGLNYYVYPKEIIRTFQEKGWKVNFYEIEPRTLVFKTLRYANPKIYRKLIDQYHFDLIEKELNNSYDLVFFLTVHFFSQANLLALKKSHENSKFVLYNWDPVTIFNYIPYLNYFNQTFTFDKEDAIKYELNYLPLFCIEAFYQNKHKSEQIFKQDVYMVGNLVSTRRYESVKKFADYCRANGIIFKYFLKTTPVVFFRLLMAGYLPFGIKMRSIRKTEFLDLMRQSRAVYDFSNHIQSGYTMRVIENFCANKKIITNNPLLNEEPFFSKDRFFIFKGFDYDGVKEFIYTPMKQESYSETFWLHNWVETIINSVELN